MVTKQDFTPGTPVSFGIRPLQKGMISDGPSSALDYDSFRELDGVYVSPQGLTRVGGFQVFSANKIPFFFSNLDPDATRHLSETPLGLITFSLANGSAKTLAITSKCLYANLSDNWFPIYWKKEFTSFTYNGSGNDAIITTPAADFSDAELSDNDWIYLVDDIYQVKTAIVSGSDYLITVTGKPSTTPTAFKVLRPFKDTPSWTTGKNSVFIVDNSTPFIFVYGELDSSSEYCNSIILKESSTDSTKTLLTAKSIFFFKDRLWFVNVQEDSSTRLRQRVRWTEVLDWHYSSATYYIDLPYRQGGLNTIVGINDILIIFAEDTIYYGVETNMIGIPYVFYEAPTGGITAVSPRAISTLLGAIVFVGQDDLYMITSQGSSSAPAFQRAGMPVTRDFYGPEVDLKKTAIVNDAFDSFLVVATSKTTELDNFWLFNYKTKSWSKMSGFPMSCLTYNLFSKFYTPDSLDPSWSYDVSPISSMAIDTFSATFEEFRLFGITYDGYVYYYNGKATGHTTVSGTFPIYSKIETQDFDFGGPEDTKTFLEIGFRVLYPITQDLNFKVEASGNRGRTWKNIGTLSFTPEEDEDKLSFRLTSSTARFRITSGIEDGVTNNIAPPWSILEITMRLKMRTNKEYRRAQ